MCEDGKEPSRFHDGSRTLSYTRDGNFDPHIFQEALAKYVLLP
jgi:hypothetical protein